MSHPATKCSECSKCLSQQHFPKMLKTVDKAKTVVKLKYLIMIIGFSNMNDAHQCTCGWMDWGQKITSTIRWEVRGKDTKLHGIV